MGEVVDFPKVQPLRCESGSPTCGPVVQFDDHDVPLCQHCWDGLETETYKQRRAREAGLTLVSTKPQQALQEPTDGGG